MFILHYIYWFGRNRFVNWENLDTIHWRLNYNQFWLSHLYKCLVKVWKIQSICWLNMNIVAGINKQTSSKRGWWHFEWICFDNMKFCRTQSYLRHQQPLITWFYRVGHTSYTFTGCPKKNESFVRFRVFYLGRGVFRGSFSPETKFVL